MGDLESRLDGILALLAAADRTSHFTVSNQELANELGREVADVSDELAVLASRDQVALDELYGSPRLIMARIKGEGHAQAIRAAERAKRNDPAPILAQLRSYRADLRLFADGLDKAARYSMVPGSRMPMADQQAHNDVRESLLHRRRAVEETVIRLLHRPILAKVSPGSAGARVSIWDTVLYERPGLNQAKQATKLADRLSELIGHVEDDPSVIQRMSAPTIETTAKTLPAPREVHQYYGPVYQSRNGAVYVTTVAIHDEERVSLTEAIDELRKAIDELDLPEVDRQTWSEATETLRTAADGSTPDRTPLARAWGGLKGVSEVLDRGEGTIQGAQRVFGWVDTLRKLIEPILQLPPPPPIPPGIMV